MGLPPDPNALLSRLFCFWRLLNTSNLLLRFPCGPRSVPRNLSTGLIQIATVGSAPEPEALLGDKILTRASAQTQNYKSALKKVLFPLFA